MELDAKTLAASQADIDLFNQAADAIRGLQGSVNVRQVIVSSRYQEIVVIGDDFSHVCLRGFQA